MRYGAVLSAVMLCVACDTSTSKSFEDIDSTSVEHCITSDILGDRKPTTPDGLVEWSWYNFMTYNFSCQEPLTEEFLLNDSSFPESLAVYDALEFAQEAWMGNHPQRSFETSLSLYITLDDTFYVGADAWSVVFATTEQLPVSDERVLAFARQNLFEDGNLSCDITVALNNPEGAPIKWTTNSTVDSDAFSLPNVLMHELGHCIGMAHPDSGFGTGTIMRSKTQAGDDVSFLPPVDRDAMRLLYPPEVEEG